MVDMSGMTPVLFWARDPHNERIGQFNFVELFKAVNEIGSNECHECHFVSRPYSLRATESGQTLETAYNILPYSALEFFNSNKKSWNKVAF